MYCEDVGETFITCPPNAVTRGAYSASGSMTAMSSVVIRKEFVISLFAEKDLPAPGVPSISPFGFFSFFLSHMIRLLLSALTP